MKALLIILLIFPSFSVAKESKDNLDINLLMTLDLNQIQDHVQKHINKSEDIAIESQKDGYDNVDDAVAELKQATLIVLARPNRDFMTSRLLPNVEKKLNAYQAYHSTLIELVKDSSKIIADKKTEVKTKSAYYYVIENILAELKKHVIKKNENATKVYRAIASEKIKIPKKLSQFRLLEKMEEGDFDPSGHAKKVLGTYGEEKDKKKPWYKFW